ncbi:hypothetical protein EW146_g8761 [Bondarzewia mesenterica]|uniref:Uncharacterized protein n=1 Tax=Bondarzewia mesenterica TaxID=1095465 RepID=A0A4S4LCA3_9AGAM|nr:hypothetical protein EW146_g8761 [Bondarzewia mesenterica]
MRVTLIDTINSSSLFCLSLIVMAGSSTKKTSVTAAQRLAMPSTASTPSDALVDQSPSIETAQIPPNNSSTADMPFVQPVTVIMASTGVAMLDSLTLSPVSTSLTPSTPSAGIVPSPIHLSTGDMLPFLPICLIKTHDRLLQSGSYLGDRSLKPTVDVVLDDSGVPLGGHDLANLSTVSVVSASDFWMTADGGYRGPSPFCSCLADVKPLLALETPDSTPYNVDFTETIRNLLQLQE